MPFRATEMFFYGDGLSHESMVHESPSSDECYQALIDATTSDPTFLGRVLEIDGNGQMIMDHSGAYPRWKEPVYPNFYLAAMRGR